MRWGGQHKAFVCTELLLAPRSQRLLPWVCPPKLQGTGWWCCESIGWREEYWLAEVGPCSVCTGDLGAAETPSARTWDWPSDLCPGRTSLPVFVCLAARGTQETHKPLGLTPALIHLFTPPLTPATSFPSLWSFFLAFWSQHLADRHQQCQLATEAWTLIWEFTVIVYFHDDKTCCGLYFWVWPVSWSPWRHVQPHREGSGHLLNPDSLLAPPRRPHN